MNLKLVEDSGYYGNDKRAINRHRSLKFEDEKGQLFILSKTLDGIPPFYEAYGPFNRDFVGVTPRLKVEGKDYWGSGITWKQAKEKFFQAVQERKER